MTAPILTTKLYIPPPRPRMVSRARLVRRLGEGAQRKLTLIVNNAGINLTGTVDGFSLDDFDRLVAVNIRAAFVATQEASRHMTAGGHIINIGSTLAERGLYPGLAFYSMTKAAIAALTRGFALDLAPRAIKVNNIQPGPISTDMTPESEAFKSIVPLKRYGTADEVASLVSYLISPEASFITGASLTIDGGVRAA